MRLALVCFYCLCFCLCFLFYRDDVLCWLLPCPSFSVSMLISDSRFDLVWFRLSCDHGWIRSGSVNARKQQQQLIVTSRETKLARVTRDLSACVCVCVFFPFILDIKFVGRTSRGHTGGRSHRISNPPSFCGACLDFCREKDSAIPFPRRP